MEDKAFLQHALEQSFLHPLVIESERIKITSDSFCCETLQISDTEFLYAQPYRITAEQIKKYMQNISAVISTRQNKRLYTEYELYKHDLTENIIVPNTYPDIKKIGKQLDLQTVSRQSAQKKKITATLFPPSFITEFNKITEQYTAVLNRCKELLKQNQKAVGLSLIADFAAIFEQNMKKFGLSHFVFWINRKRFLYYLNEAAQLLKTHQQLDADFCRTHTFFGEKIKLMHKSVAQCHTMLHELVRLLQEMSFDSQLYGIVQELLVSRQRFDNALKQYRSQNPADNVAQITSIRHNMSDIFKSYALLCYFNGVRCAFEYKYLNEAPQQRNPELPTVSPQDEIKKIAKIVGESTKIDSSAGKLGKLYTSALGKYASTQRKLQSLLTH